MSDQKGELSGLQSHEETKESLIRVWLNPLQILEIDEPWARAQPSEISAKVYLDFLCTPGVASDEQSLGERYREISREKSRLFAVPSDPRILKTLVWPLRHAKAAYTVGNYLATVSLAGIVAEMVALLLFDLATINNHVAFSSADKQKRLFGSTFERLGQERRVNILQAIGAAGDQEVKAFDRIRTIRRMYLHLRSNGEDDAEVAKQAVIAFNDAVFLVVKAIGLEILEGGRLSLKPELLQFLATAAKPAPPAN